MTMVRKYERTWKGQELDGPVTWWYENGQARDKLQGRQEGRVFYCLE